MSDGMVVISKEELAALIANRAWHQFGSLIRSKELAARVVDALPTSEPADVSDRMVTATTQAIYAWFAMASLGTRDMAPLDEWKPLARAVLVAALEVESVYRKPGDAT